jgi:hypothetical protein
MRWLRLYTELLDDPKVQRLPATLFRTWINLLCLAGKADGRLPATADLAFALRLSEAEAQEAVGALTARGLLDPAGDVLMPHNWHGRQFPSDNVSERVKRYRERSRNGPEEIRSEEIRADQTRSPTVSISPNRARPPAREQQRKPEHKQEEFDDGNAGGRPATSTSAAHDQAWASRHVAHAAGYGFELADAGLSDLPRPALGTPSGAEPGSIRADLPRGTVSDL